ncbi:hypothetical protein GGU11DRAFT_761168, partial [Lentinula aff. detonsa]
MQEIPEKDDILAEIPEKDDILAEIPEKDDILAEIPEKTTFLRQTTKSGRISGAMAKVSINISGRRTFRTRIRKLNKIERLPKLVTEFETSSGDSFEVKEPKLLQAFRAVGVVPFWEEECPAEYEQQWGERWEHIHETLEEMSNIARKTEVDKFHWTKMDVQDVAKVAREEGWEACLDAEIQSYLKSQEWDIQTRYMRAIQADPKADFVLMGAWDSEMIQIVTHLLGDGALDEQRAVYSVVKDWWHSMISALLDTSRKYKIRALHRLLIAEKRVKEL